LINFDETFMSAGDPLVGSREVGFGASNRVASTSRVERKAAKSVITGKPVKKGLHRSTVSIVPKDARTWVVVVKGSRQVLGTIRGSKGAKGKAYSYKLLSEARSHNGFGSRAAALARMLEKC
jgi:glutamate dehydrogenase/leucine dehydrogenase